MILTFETFSTLFTNKNSGLFNCSQMKFVFILVLLVFLCIFCTSNFLLVFCLTIFEVNVSDFTSYFLCVEFFLNWTLKQ